jgi:hypothetical protein
LGVRGMVLASALVLMLVRTLVLASGDWSRVIRESGGLVNWGGFGFRKGQEKEMEERRGWVTQ